jgi:hypothetical protein
VDFFLFFVMLEMDLLLERKRVYELHAAKHKREDRIKANDVKGNNERLCTKQHLDDHDGKVYTRNRRRNMRHGDRMAAEHSIGEPLLHSHVEVVQTSKPATQHIGVYHSWIR